MDSMSGCDIRLVFTFPPKDSTLQYKNCVNLCNNFPRISTLLLPTVSESLTPIVMNILVCIDRRRKSNLCFIAGTALWPRGTTLWPSGTTLWPRGTTLWPCVDSLVLNLQSCICSKARLTGYIIEIIINSSLIKGVMIKNVRNFNLLV